MKLRQVGKLLKYTIAVGAVGTTGILLQRNDWQVGSIGAVRFGRAAVTAVSVVLDYKWSLRGLDPASAKYQDVKSETHLRSALRLRGMCCVNGGCFIKVGQHIGSLDYLLPPEYVSTMKVLHKDAPQSPVDDIRRVLRDDLGEEIEEKIESFETRPLGAASLAQVHKVIMKDGRILAIKIQHPQVKAHSFVDMATMELLVYGVAWLFPEFKFLWLAEETKKNLPKELDFLHEGKNCERVSRMLKHFEFLKVPQVHWDLSSERVLAMEYCEGGQVNDREYYKQHGISVREVSTKLGQLYSEMIFVQGYIHCDPHPGNVLVHKTKQGTELVLLDHGLYQTLTDEFRINYCKLWQALIKADMPGIKQYADVMGCGDLYGLFACIITGRSWTAVSSGIDKQDKTEAEATEIKENAALYLPQISDILNRIPRQMLLILKTNDLLRGIESTLHTEASASSFITMSRCCVRAVSHDALLKCDGFICQFWARMNLSLSLTSLVLYEWYLWLRFSILRLLPIGWL